MGVDQTSLDRIRNATFPSSRRGYDKREVERFLARLADWLETGGGDEPRSDSVKRELERVGQRTGAILAQAEESAQQIRADADAYADETRKKADDEAETTLVEAEQEARETIAEAQQTARRIVEEGDRRRRDIESLIADLVLRRDEVLSDTEALTETLTRALHEHRPADEDPFAEPADFDPLEGEGDDEPFDSDDADVDSEEGEEPAEVEDGAEAEPTEVEDAAEAEEGDETVESDAAKPSPQAGRRSRSSKVKA
jgi:DivIVA domain-containing protein